MLSYEYIPTFKLHCPFCGRTVLIRDNRLPSSDKERADFFEKVSKEYRQRITLLEHELQGRLPIA